MYDAMQKLTDEEATQAVDGLVGRYGWRRFLLELAEQAGEDAARQEDAPTRKALRRTAQALTRAVDGAPEQR